MKFSRKCQFSCHYIIYMKAIDTKCFRLLPTFQQILIFSFSINIEKRKRLKYEVFFKHNKFQIQFYTARNNNVLRNNDPFATAR